VCRKSRNYGKKGKLRQINIHKYGNNRNNKVNVKENKIKINHNDRNLDNKRKAECGKQGMEEKWESKRRIKGE
jgi:hypothetical protein